MKSIETIAAKKGQNMGLKQYTRVCARINLDAIEYNIEQMHRNLEEGTRMMVVVKTDGYGHGAVPIAQMLSAKEYIWGFATATIEEGVSLRKAGVTKPVLVLGAAFPDQRQILLEHELRMTCYTVEMAEEISALAGKLGKKAYLHVKIDTGMSRLGFPVCEESADEIAGISALPGIQLEGLYTHFARADEQDKKATEKQLESYLWMKSALEEKGVSFSCCHCANSAGIIDLPKTGMGLVRAGIAAYGLYPSDEVEKKRVPLIPALELISHAAHVKWVEAGTPIGYGGTYVTERPTRIVTVPVGYGDGYPRSMSNKGCVLIHGQKAPILGRICMDQFMADVTEIDNVEYGDRIVLIGKDKDEEISVDMLSELSGRFNYEFVTGFGIRIPREYIRNGKVVAQIDFFGD